VSVVWCCEEKREREREREKIIAAAVLGGGLEEGLREVKK